MQAVFLIFFSFFAKKYKHLQWLWYVSSAHLSWRLFLWRCMAMYGDVAAVLRWYGDAVAMLRWYCDAVAMRLRQKPYACECAGMSEHNIKNITRRLENICL